VELYLHSSSTSSLHAAYLSTGTLPYICVPSIAFPTSLYFGLFNIFPLKCFSRTTYEKVNIYKVLMYLNITSDQMDILFSPGLDVCVKKRLPV